MSNPYQPGKVFVADAKNEEDALNKYLENLRISSASIDPRRDRDRALGFKAGYDAASSSIEGQKEEIRRMAWDAWKEVYRINCTFDGDEFVGYDWSMIELEFITWWDKRSVGAKAAHTAAED